MKPTTARIIIVTMDILAILTLWTAIIFIWYFVEPIKVANNPFYAVSKIPGAVCYINGIKVSDFVKPEDIKYVYPNMTLNFSQLKPMEP